MAQKQVAIDGIGTVTLYKRANSKAIRLSISHKGDVRVTLPTWVPYSAATAFVRTRKDWILDKLPETKQLPIGYALGKTHNLSFERGSGTSISTRITGNSARVLLPGSMKWDDEPAQDAARALGVRVLKKEARMLLPYRLQQLADTHGFTFSSVTIKQLTGRWGSCDSKQNITLNCFLMQLPWELIDYVLIHELVHTEIMAHGAPFWARAAVALPDVQTRRSAIKKYQPVI